MPDKTPIFDHAGDKFQPTYDWRKPGPAAAELLEMGPLAAQKKSLPTTDLAKYSRLRRVSRRHAFRAISPSNFNHFRR
jgi:hypothetical protein